MRLRGTPKYCINGSQLFNNNFYGKSFALASTSSIVERIRRWRLTEIFKVHLQVSKGHSPQRDCEIRQSILLMFPPYYKQLLWEEFVLAFTSSLVARFRRWILTEIFKVHLQVSKGHSPQRGCEIHQSILLMFFILLTTTFLRRVFHEHLPVHHLLCYETWRTVTII